MAQIKIKVNQNLLSLFNYINTSETYVTWSELIQWALDYECYKELFLHHLMIDHLMIDHNNQILKNEKGI